jgi:hypothetical protein
MTVCRKGGLGRLTGPFVVSAFGQTAKMCITINQGKSVLYHYDRTRVCCLGILLRWLSNSEVRPMLKY